MDNNLPQNPQPEVPPVPQPLEPTPTVPVQPEPQPQPVVSQPVIPPTPPAEPNQTPPPSMPTSTPNKSNLVLIIGIIFLVLSIVGLAGYFVYNKILVGKTSTIQTPTPTETITSTPTATPTEPVSEKPVVSTPSANLKVKSPLLVAGTVPAGWMFEGVFPIQLVDLNKKLIAQGQGKETTPGSWQTGIAVPFEATLTFTTSTKSGILILKNDNPSGDPTKQQTFEVPVSF